MRAAAHSERCYCHWHSWPKVESWEPKACTQALDAGTEDPEHRSAAHKPARGNPCFLMPLDARRLRPVCREQSHYPPKALLNFFPSRPPCDQLMLRGAMGGLMTEPLCE